MNILVSACLLGMDCRYDGTHAYQPALDRLMEEHMLIPVCPERRGGLPTPRLPAERRPDGTVVLSDGTDVTEAFASGARATLALARQFGCKYAVLKARSPSCGAGSLYDGSFTGTLVPGDGVTAALLRENGIIVLTEHQLDALVHLRTTEET